MLRVVAIIGVVSIHTFGAIVTNPALEGQRGWWLAVVLNAGFIWAVPVFVMISGALVLDPRMHAKGPGDFYRTRFSRLLVPFVFWQVFYVLVVRRLLSGLDDSPGTVLALVLDGRTYTHLYFLWLIVGLYAVAPVLEAFLRQGGRRRALTFAFVALGATVLTYSSAAILGAAGMSRPLLLMALTQWIPYVGYFLAGWALRDVHPRGARLALAAAVAALAIGEVIVQTGTGPHPVLGAILPTSYLGPMTALAAVALFLAVNGALAGVRMPRVAGCVLTELSESAFGVFLVHFRRPDPRASAAVLRAGHAVRRRRAGCPVRHRDPVLRGHDGPAQDAVPPAARVTSAPRASEGIPAPA